MERKYLYSGLISPIIGFLFIGIAIYLNSSWWRITDNAISDLGNIYHSWVNYPWVLSAGLIIGGLGMTYFSYGLQKEFEGVAKWGIYVYLLGMIFLTLIGVFPEGTPPHWYVSWAFFLTASFGILVGGVGFLLRYSRKMGMFSIALYVISWVLAVWVLRTFKGVAIAEFMGAITLFIWSYTTIFWNMRREKL
ncbi:putative membrane protein [Aciduliprofundum sp. MAR08-339]|uniref:DUF998 domain-containing protein n=1 Tax=Aciduliprofundum sp. (strain MAR08-339) TaxID=673860 RepID=UPI0002A49E90|nr:putative membrane protein [Aciduliprofundum sp. MAR08-339]